MKELIARLEAAAGPSSDLDEAIALAVGMRMFNIETGAEVGRGPNFTYSIDAALTLAEHRTFAVLLEALAMASAYFASFIDKNGHIAKAMPRFICIAALKARMAEEGRG